MKKPSNFKKILDAFEEEWGFEKNFPEDLVFEEPLDNLVLTILSQNTNDINRDKAFKILREQYPTWEETALASESDIAQRIKIAGLGNTKASYIKQALNTVKDKFGEYSIKELKKWDPKDVREFLVSLPGVGVKTAGIVMVFDLGMPSFPVDTHVARISRRLGWAEEKTTPEKIQLYLEATLPEERFAGAHLNFLKQGRTICSARNPKCGECTVKKWCKFGKSLDV
ncbi:MAG: endonuclease III domain-containing protein [Synergistaceae bacterium]|jgi:endonuclease-3